MSLQDADLGRSPTYRARHAIGPWIDRTIRAFGRANYLVRSAEYVGTVHAPVADLEARLRAGGFSWDPFSLYHRTPAGTRPNGSWALRSSPLADRQLHAVLFEQSDERVDVYAHDEHNWLRHPVAHAEQRDVRRRAGADRMRQWLEARGIGYERESVVRRKAAHLAERVRERFTGRRATHGTP